MARVYRTFGLILSQRELSERDRLYVIFTRDFGKKTILTKGIKREGAKLRYCLSLYTFVDMECVPGRSFDRLISVKDKQTISDSLGSLSDQLYPYSIALILFDLIERVCQDSNPEPDVFVEISRLLRILSQSTSQEWDLFVVFLIFRMMFLVGFGLELTRCVRSGKTYAPEFVLCIREGGIVNTRYLDLSEGDMPVTKEDILVLRGFQAGYFTEPLAQTSLSAQRIQMLLHVSLQYVEYHGISLNALSFWRHIRYHVY